jgi:hypothetical protein
LAKKLAKNLVFLTQNAAYLGTTKINHEFGFQEYPQFFVKTGKNRRKSPKILITTLKKDRQ